VYLAAYVPTNGSQSQGTSSVGLNLNLVASVMEDLRRIGNVRDGVTVRHLVRVTADPVAEALVQIIDSQIDAVLTAADSDLTRPLLGEARCHVLVYPSGRWELAEQVQVLVGEGSDDDTALELGLRFAMGRIERSPVALAPVLPKDRNRAHRLAEKADSISLLHGVVTVAEALPDEGVVFAGVASAATATDRRGGPLVAVRSGDDPQRVNLDQRFDHLRVAAAHTLHLANAPTPSSVREA
jgi:hypothetical protein